MCPVMFDAKTLALSVVTADPDDLEALREAQLASGAREVKGVFARPAAVKALIAKAYPGDIHAFALLDRQAHAQTHAMRSYGGNDIALDDRPPSLRRRASRASRSRLRSPTPAAPAAGPRAAGAGGARGVSGGRPIAGRTPEGQRRVVRRAAPRARQPAREHARPICAATRRRSRASCAAWATSSGSTSATRRCSSSRPSSTTSARWASTT